MILRIRKHSRKTSTILLLLFVFQLIPNEVFALTGGPTQEEFQNFTPANNTDMVNLTNGNFSYNLPLMDIGGYPVNIFYDSNVQMEQEASWVGLGWNLNVGSLNRNKRGLPDDFKGDLVKQELSQAVQESRGDGLGFRARFGASGSVPIPIGAPAVSATVGASAAFTLALAGGRIYNSHAQIQNSFEGSIYMGLELGLNAGVKVGFSPGMGDREEDAAEQQANEQENQDSNETGSSSNNSNDESENEEDSAPSLGVSASVGASVGVNGAFNLAYNGFSGMTLSLTGGTSAGVYANASAGIGPASVGVGVSAVKNNTVSKSISSRQGVLGVSSTSGFNVSKSITAELEFSNDPKQKQTRDLFEESPSGSYFNTQSGSMSYSNGASTTNKLLQPSRAYTPGMKHSMLSSTTSNKKTFFVDISIGIGKAGKFSGSVSGAFYMIYKDTRRSLKYLAENNFEIPSYGNLYAEYSDKRQGVLLDYNRYNDLGFINEDAVHLSYATKTFDSFMANAQGMGLSFRSSRSDIGNIYSNYAYEALSGAGLKNTERGDGISVSLNLKQLLKKKEKPKKKSPIGLGYTKEKVDGSGTLSSYSSYWSELGGNELFDFYKFYGFEDMDRTVAKNLSYQPVSFTTIGMADNNEEEMALLIGSYNQAVRAKMKTGSGQNEGQVVLTRQFTTYNSKDNTYGSFESSESGYVVDRVKQQNFIIYKTLDESLVNKAFKDNGLSYTSDPNFNYYTNIQNYPSTENGIGALMLSNGMLTGKWSSIPDGSDKVNNPIYFESIAKEHIVPENHHISEYLIKSDDGSSFYYGTPVISKNEKEVLMSVPSVSETGVTLNENQILLNEAKANLYESVDNNAGIDKFFSRKTLPSYASNYLLNAVFSPNYIDVTGDGPTQDDLGNFTKFNYTKFQDYTWRSSIPEDGNETTSSVTRMEGVNSDLKDDKSMYTSGSRDHWYLHSIETKEFIAVFELGKRLDGAGVDNKGRIESESSRKRLKAIKLYAKEDLVHPIKVVNFTYDYELCPQTPNSKATNKGKLTLKSIYFSSGKSDRLAFNPYTFEYSNENPSYKLTQTDKWGVNMDADDHAKDYPYADQSSDRNFKVAAWTLKKVNFPTGGELEVEFESDRYTYVNNEKAAMMYEIIGGTNDANGWGSDPRVDLRKNKYLCIEVKKDITTSELRKSLRTLKKYDGKYWALFKGDVYLKQGLDYELQNFYVPIVVDDCHVITEGASSRGTKVLIKVGETALNEEGKVLSFGKNISFITHLTMQNARRYNSNIIYPVGQDVLDVIDEFVSFFRGINSRLNGWNVGRYVKTNNSAFFRLPMFEDEKYGGGKRIKSLTQRDNWNEMVNGEKEIVVRQVYTYGKGVLNYGTFDDDMMKSPTFYEIENKGAPNDIMFEEFKSGDELFPTGSICYESVRISNDYLTENTDPSGVYTKNKPGDMEYFFYTNREFPYVSSTTGIDKRIPNIDDVTTTKTRASGFDDLVGTSVSFSYDLANMTEGVLVMSNDMQGQMKEMRKYDALGNIMAGQKYKYKQDDNGLNNYVPVVGRDNNITQQRLLFTKTDAVNDSRMNINNFTSNRYSKSQYIGLDNLLGIAVDVVKGFFTGGPEWDQLGRINEHTSIENSIKEFYSNVTTKVVDQRGIQVEVENYDNVNNTKTLFQNVLWDEETGEVLLQKEITMYHNENLDEQRVGSEYYMFKYPVHWTSRGLSGAYQNQGMVFDEEIFDDQAASGSLEIRPDFATMFFPGDELMLLLPQGSDYVPTEHRGWVVENEETGKYAIIDHEGQYQSAFINNSSNCRVKVMKSGAANMSKVTAGTVVLFDNPEGETSINLSGKRALTSVATTFTDNAVMGISEPYSISYPSQSPTQLGQEMNEIFSNGTLIGLFGPSLDISCPIYVNTEKQTSPYTRIFGDIYYNTSYLKNELIIGANSSSNCFYSRALFSSDRGVNAKDIRFYSNVGDRNESTASSGTYSNNVQQAMARVSNIATSARAASVPNTDGNNGGSGSRACEGVIPTWLEWGRIVFDEDINMDVLKISSTDFQGIQPSTHESEAHPLDRFKFVFSTNSGLITVNASFHPQIEGTLHLWQPDVIRGTKDVLNKKYAVGDVVNPYLTGLRGRWHKSNEYVFKEGLLTSDNGDFASRGMFDESFSPFWLYDDQSGYWNSNTAGYFTPGEYTLIDNHDRIREVKDLNNMYSANIMGYGNRLQVAVAQNARYREIASENFETFGLQTAHGDEDCSLFGELDFSSSPQNSEMVVTDEYAHTGRKSFFIPAGNSFNMVRPILPGQPENEVHEVPFMLKRSDNLLSFSPETESGKKYRMSFWVKSVSRKLFANDGAPAEDDHADDDLLDVQLMVDGTSVALTKEVGPLVNGWRNVQVEFTMPYLSNANKEFVISLQNNLPSVLAGPDMVQELGPNAVVNDYYIDDFRLFPVGAYMMTTVYDPVYYRKLAELDDHNYATVYEYDEDGVLIRVKRETEKGLRTVSETRVGNLK